MYLINHSGYNNEARYEISGDRLITVNKAIIYFVGEEEWWPPDSLSVEWTVVEHKLWQKKGDGGMTNPKPNWPVHELLLPPCLCWCIQHLDRRAKFSKYVLLLVPGLFLSCIVDMFLRFGAHHYDRDGMGGGGQEPHAKYEKDRN